MPFLTRKYARIAFAARTQPWTTL